MMDDARSYWELRVGFTAAVSHELRTPLARLMVLLETAALPGADRDQLIAQAREQVEQMNELVDDVLFLSELESGRADVGIVVDADASVELPLRRRMLGVVVENLAVNAVRYAGPGATLTLSAHPGLLEAADDGRGIEEEDLPRLFERFYRSDRARASRGTGLGLAIVKHVVVSAGGQVEASGGPGRGLRIVCTFPGP